LKSVRVTEIFIVV